MVMNVDMETYGGNSPKGQKKIERCTVLFILTVRWTQSFGHV